MPRDGRATRERILSAAQKLVIENGYAATSVDQVIAASASSKGAFFHHFESKRALADALVDRYVASDIAFLDDALAAAREHSDPAERAIAFLRFFEDMADELMEEQSGCLYTSILTERELVTSGASDPITKAVVIWREGYAALLRDALGDSHGRGRRRGGRPRLGHLRGCLPPGPHHGRPGAHAPPAGDAANAGQRPAGMTSTRR